MNSDPRLEFGMGTPVIQEMAPPEPSELLRASREPLRRMMGIETDEDWQVRPAAFWLKLCVVQQWHCALCGQC